MQKKKKKNEKNYFLIEYIVTYSYLSKQREKNYESLKSIMT